MTYAIDFDGTLCEKAWPDIGAEKVDIVEYCKVLKSKGHKLILWTCREGERKDEAVEWCAQRGLYFDAVNENITEHIDFFGNDSRKVYADFYIDDKNKPISECKINQQTKEVETVDKYWKMQQGEKPATADIYLYGDIEGDTKDWWTGVILPSPTSANTFKTELEALGKLEEVNIYINSFGGYCSEGHAIANIIRRCKAKTIAHIDAYAASVASIIACACDEVRMPRNTVMMIHNAWVAYASGNAAQLRKLADDLDTENAAFKTVYLEKSNGKITPKKLDELLDNETYLTAEECFSYGFCDVIEDFSAEMKDPDEAQVKAAERNRVDLNKVCAMIRGETGKIPVQTGPEPKVPEPQADGTEPAGNGEKVNTNKLDAGPAPSFIMSILRKRKEDNND